MDVAAFDAVAVAAIGVVPVAAPVTVAVVCVVPISFAWCIAHISKM